MSRKSLTLALAAVVSLGAVALSASTASAFHGGGAGAPATGGSHTAAPPRTSVTRPGLVTGIKIKPGHPVVTGIKIPPKPPIIAGISIFPKHHHHAHWPRWYWWRYTTWGRPYLAAPVVAGGVATYAATTTNR